MEQASSFVNGLLEKYSSKYTSDIVILLKEISKWAAKTYEIKDCLQNLDIPKVRKQEPVMLTSKENKTLMKYLRKKITPTKAGILLTMYTGLRIGELCALTWKEIDLEQKVLYVRKTLQRIYVKGWKRKTMVTATTPKTESSVREIPLPESIVKILKKIRSGKNTYLLSGSESFIEPRTLSNRFKKILKDLELTDVHFHSLRHNFATKCLQSRFDIKTLSEILGHSNAGVTMRIYVHTSLEQKRACMSLLKY